MKHFSFLTALTITLFSVCPLHAMQEGSPLPEGGGKIGGVLGRVQAFMTGNAREETLRNTAGSGDEGGESTELVVAPAPVAPALAPIAPANSELMLDSFREQGIVIPEGQESAYLNALLTVHATGRGDERFVIASTALGGALTPAQISQTFAGFDTQFQLHQQLLQSHGREIGAVRTGVNHLQAGEQLSREEAAALSDRITAFEGRVDSRFIEHDRRLTSIWETTTVSGRVAALLAEFFKAERIDKLTAQLVGFTPWAMAFLPHTLVALFGTHVATRAPIGPLRKVVRPVQGLLWFTFVLTALRASKVGTDRAQVWAEKELAPHLRRVMGANKQMSQVEARRIATAASVCAALVGAWYFRGLLKPTFLTRSQNPRKK